MCVLRGGGRRRRTTPSFDYFLPGLTSRRAHLMQFQLPQTIPQPQRSRECGITVGRRGARGQATRGAGECGSTGPRRSDGSVPLLVQSGVVGRRTHPLLAGGWGDGVGGPRLLPPTSPRRGVPPPLPEIHFLKN